MSVSEVFGLLRIIGGNIAVVHIAAGSLFSTIRFLFIFVVNNLTNCIFNLLYEK
jgi:hypothetical protein